MQKRPENAPAPQYVPMHTLHQKSDYPAPRSGGRFFLERGWEGDLGRPLRPCGFLASVHLSQGHLLPHRPSPMDFPPAAFSTGQYLGNNFEKTAHVSQGSQERVRRPKGSYLSPHRSPLFCFQLPPGWIHLRTWSGSIPQAGSCQLWPSLPRKSQRAWNPRCPVSHPLTSRSSCFFFFFHFVEAFFQFYVLKLLLIFNRHFLEGFYISRKIMKIIKFSYPLHTISPVINILH